MIPRAPEGQRRTHNVHKSYLVAEVDALVTSVELGLEYIVAVQDSRGDAQVAYCRGEEV